MIERLIRVANVGVFADARPASDRTRFDPLTLIYAENGRGKTTLSAILRSLATDDPVYVTERARIGAAEPPEIELRVSGSNLVFANGAWNDKFSQILIFDDTFVEENVCSGLSVTLEQRRHLHGIIVGQRGVELARREVELAEAIRKATSSLGVLEEKIEPAIVGTMTVDQFCALPEQEDLESAIAEKEKELKAHRAGDDIRTKGQFSKVVLSAVSAEAIQELLAKGLPELNADAATRVRLHLSRLADGGEEWVSNGMIHPHADTCPFCGRDVHGLQLIKDYQSYFSEAYSSFKEEVSDAKRNIGRKLGGDALATLVQQIAAEEAKRVFWAGFTDVPKSGYDLDCIRKSWSALEKALSGLLAEKASAPLETISIDSATTAALADFEAAAADVRRTSAAMTNANAAIGRIKSDTAEPGVAATSAALERLKSVKARHSKSVVPLCEQYETIVKAREEHKTAKEKVKRDLGTLSRTIFKQYGAAINRHLRDFGAGFEIAGMKEAHDGGKPGSTYEILINGTGVKLGKDSTPKGTRCFRNTLSSGDRNALALSFFLARLDQDTSLADAIIVFDDPISSLDEHRQLYTEQHICRLAKKASQVIVLSHSASFLRKIWDHPGTPAKNAMKIAGGASGSAIKPWNIEQETETEYQKFRSVLVEFRDKNKGEPRSVASSIRLLLEGYLRVVYPDHIKRGQWLGDFMTSAKAASDAGVSIICQKDYDDLEDLLAYSSRFHHNTNPSASIGPISETQLAVCVNKALGFVSGGKL